MVSSRSLGLSAGGRSRRVRSLEEVVRSTQARCEEEAPGTGMGKLLDSSRREVDLRSMQLQLSWHQPRRLRQYQATLQ